MGKFLLYLAIAFIIWRIVVTLSRKGSAPTTQVRGTPPPEERIEPRRGPEIDYSRVRDAEYREIDTRRLDRDRAGRTQGDSSRDDREPDDRVPNDRSKGEGAPDDRAPRDAGDRIDPGAG